MPVCNSGKSASKDESLRACCRPFLRGITAPVKHTIESLVRSSPDRAGLVGFLAGFESDTRGQEFWRRRLAFWWDENPACKDNSPCGWALRADERIVGFLGVVPGEYVHGGNFFPAHAATTWRVNREHRQASLPLFVQWHRLGAEAILLDTTPSEETRRVLERFQYRSQKKLCNHFFPLPGGGRSLKAIGFRALAALNKWFLPREPLKLVTLADKFDVAVNPADAGRLQKRISRDYLRWFCRAPGVSRHFIGCVDGQGMLTSYLILQPDTYGEKPVLSAIDHFTANSDGRELLALIRHVLVQPEKFTAGGRADFLMLNFLEAPPFTSKPPGVFVRENLGKHYYSLPESLTGVSKRCVLAEGDYGC
jgi:hypothetical protein